MFCIQNYYSMNVSILCFAMLLVYQQNQRTIDLKDHIWSKRIVCIEAIDMSQALEQITNFKQAIKGNQERKILFYTKILNSYYEGLELNEIEKIKNFPSNQNKNNLIITLIGLDGGMKYKWNETIEPIVVFQKIDAMPMRVYENRKF